MRRDLIGDRRGTTAVEMALVLPMLVMLVMGVINGSLLAAVVSSMNFAVQEAARCSAVNHTTCGASQDTVAFAQARYDGPAAMPAFAADLVACGYRVTASTEFTLNVGIAVYDVPLSAEACFPGDVV